MAFRPTSVARSLFPLVVLLVVACVDPPAESPRSVVGTAPTPDTARLAEAEVDSAGTLEAEGLASGAFETARSTGQTIYVPVYSHIYTQDQRRVVNLTVTLSVRNTDVQRGLRITAVRYYDSHGTLLRSYLNAPLDLGPLASTDFIVEERDTSGGLGANFIVEWSAPTAVTAPVVESVMISTASSQGISFVSPGRVIAERPG